MEAQNCEPKKDSRISMKERILFLDSIRAIAIIMVVGVHSLGYCLQLPSDQKEVISFIVHTISVPVFFLVDGYLFSCKISFTKNFSYYDTIKNSINRLIVPWLIFTLIYTFARYFFESLDMLNDEIIVGKSFYTIMVSSYGSVYASQMYFLFSLFLIRLFCPVFRRLILIKNYLIIILIFIIFIRLYKSSISFINPFLQIDGGQEPILHALWGVQYYFLGIILFKTREIINLEKLFVPFILLFIFSFLMRDYLFDSGLFTIQYSYLLTFFILFFIINDRFYFLNIIGKHTMGIFLIHSPIILKVVSILTNKFITFPLLNFIVLWMGVLFLSICIVIAVNYLPCGPVLFGEDNERRGRIRKSSAV